MQIKWIIQSIADLIVQLNLLSTQNPRLNRPVAAETTEPLEQRKPRSSNLAEIEFILFEFS